MIRQHVTLSHCMYLSTLTNTIDWSDIILTCVCCENCDNCDLWYGDLLNLPLNNILLL